MEFLLTVQGRSGSRPGADPAGRVGGVYHDTPDGAGSRESRENATE